MNPVPFQPPKPKTAFAFAFAFAFTLETFPAVFQIPKTSSSGLWPLTSDL